MRDYLVPALVWVIGFLIVSHAFETPGDQPLQALIGGALQGFGIFLAYVVWENRR